MTGTIEFECPHCEGKVRAQSRHAGRAGNCPTCGRRVMIPGDATDIDTSEHERPTSVAATTDVSGPISGLTGAAAAVTLYFVVFLPLGDTFVGQLFTNRGPVPFIITLVTCWGLAILVLKYLAVKRQLSYAGMELQLLPLEAGMQITPDNVPRFLRHLGGLPPKAQESILGHRIRGALSHFQSRGSVPEVQAYLSSRAELDASSVDSGYTLLRAFIWAVPILGFIGTVLGISSAVSGLAGSLETAHQAEVVSSGAAEVETPAPGEDTGGEEDNSLGAQMVKAMGGVTQGLATAFDTTFLALVMAILLLFPTEALRKTEYAMLDRIEAFTNESLLRRMSDDSEGGVLPAQIAKGLEPAFRKHQQWLAEWQNQVAELGNVIGMDFDAHVQRIERRIEGIGVTNVEDVERVTRGLSEAVRDASGLIDRWTNSGREIAESLRSMTELAVTLQNAMADNTRQLGELAAKWPHADNGAAESLNKAVDALDGHVHQLRELIAGNGATTAPAVAPKRGRLFGIFRS